LIILIKLIKKSIIKKKKLQIDGLNEENVILPVRDHFLIYNRQKDDIIDYVINKMYIQNHQIRSLFEKKLDL
jgi:hypothetical protein